MLALDVMNLGRMCKWIPRWAPQKTHVYGRLRFVRRVWRKHISYINTQKFSQKPKSIGSFAILDSKLYDYILVTRNIKKKKKTIADGITLNCPRKSLGHLGMLIIIIIIVNYAWKLRWPTTLITHQNYLLPLQLDFLIRFNCYFGTNYLCITCFVAGFLLIIYMHVWYIRELLAS